VNWPGNNRPLPTVEGKALSILKGEKEVLGVSTGLRKEYQTVNVVREKRDWKLIKYEVMSGRQLRKTQLFNLLKTPNEYSRA